MSDQIRTERVTLKIKEARENAVGAVLVCNIVALSNDMGSIDSDELRTSLIGITHNGRKVIAVELFDVLRQSIGMPVALRLGEAA